MSMKKYASDDKKIGFKGFFLLSMKYIFKSEEWMIHLTGDPKNTVTPGLFYLHKQSALLAFFNVDVLHISRLPVHTRKGLFKA